MNILRGLVTVYKGIYSTLTKLQNLILWLTLFHTPPSPPLIIGLENYGEQMVSSACICIYLIQTQKGHRLSFMCSKSFQVLFEMHNNWQFWNWNVYNRCKQACRDCLWIAAIETIHISQWYCESCFALFKNSRQIYVIV